LGLKDEPEEIPSSATPKAKRTAVVKPKAKDKGKGKALSPMKKHTVSSGPQVGRKFSVDVEMEQVNDSDGNHSEMMEQDQVEKTSEPSLTQSTNVSLKVPLARAIGSMAIEPINSPSDFQDPDHGTKTPTGPKHNRTPSLSVELDNQHIHPSKKSEFYPDPGKKTRSRTLSTSDHNDEESRSAELLVKSTKKSRACADGAKKKSNFVPVTNH
jgi:hypothetical protein